MGAHGAEAPIARVGAAHHEEVDEDAEALGIKAAEDLLAQGAGDILRAVYGHDVH